MACGVPAGEAAGVAAGVRAGVAAGVCAGVIVGVLAGVACGVVAGGAAGVRGAAAGVAARVGVGVAAPPPRQAAAMTRTKVRRTIAIAMVRGIGFFMSVGTPLLCCFDLHQSLRLRPFPGAGSIDRAPFPENNGRWPDMTAGDTG